MRHDVGCGVCGARCDEGLAHFQTGSVNSLAVAWLRRSNAIEGRCSLDLTAPGRYQSLEVIDLRGDGPQEVLLDDDAVRRIPQNQFGFSFGLARILTVLGDADDTLRLDMTGFVERGSTAGRRVYAREGAYYGLEVSPELLH